MDSETTINIVGNQDDSIAVEFPEYYNLYEDKLPFAAIKLKRYSLIPHSPILILGGFVH